jgi:hypothetical protein
MSTNSNQLSKNVRVTRAASATDAEAPTVYNAADLSAKEREIQLSNGNDPDLITPSGKTVGQLKEEYRDRVRKQKERVDEKNREMTAAILGDIKTQDVHVVESGGSIFAVAVPEPAPEIVDTAAENLKSELSNKQIPTDQEDNQPSA